MQRPVRAKLHALRITKAEMTLNAYPTLFVVPWSGRSKYTATGIYALFTPYAGILVYNPCICARFFVDYNGIYRANGEAERFHTLKTCVGLIIDLYVVLLEYDPGKA